MKKPFTEWEAWQAASALWKKWEAQHASFGAQTSDKDKKILVVDDENPIRDMVSEMLNDAGFKVFVASNGEEALKMFEDPSFKVDLLLTDIVMPKVTGIRLAESLGRKQPSVPVIFMSGFPRDQQFQQDCENGQKRFIQKPFSTDSLLRTVQDAFTTGFWSGGQWSQENRWEA
jgi:DNA-binding NtrC family response regulator